MGSRRFQRVRQLVPHGHTRRGPLAKSGSPLSGQDSSDGRARGSGLERTRANVRNRAGAAGQGAAGPARRLPRVPQRAAELARAARRAGFAGGTQELAGQRVRGVRLECALGAQHQAVPRTKKARGVRVGRAIKESCVSWSESAACGARAARRAVLAGARRRRGETGTALSARD